MRTEYYFGYNNTKIAVHIVENGDRPWILFWPGLTITTKCDHFEDFFLKLGEQYNLFIPDLRGQGMSEGEFSYHDLCEDMKIVTKKILEQKPDCILFGYSITASALVKISNEFPQAKFLLFAPVISLKDKVPHFLNKVVALKSFRQYSLPFLLFLFNVRTRKFEHKKFSELFTNWGCCRLTNLERIWDEVADFSVDFSVVQQKGIVLYGDNDHLLPHDFHEIISESQLQPVLLKNFDHFLKTSKVNTHEIKISLFLAAINNSVLLLTQSR